MREAWVSILANLVALVAIYSAFSIAIAIAQALGPATPINQVLTLAGAVVLGLVGVSGALFKLSDWFARHVEIGEEEPASPDAAQPAREDPQHAALDASTVYMGIGGLRFRLESQALMRQHLFGFGGQPWYEPLWVLVVRVAATGLWVYVALFVGVWALGQAMLWFSELAVSPGVLNAVIAVVLCVVTAVVLLLPSCFAGCAAYWSW
ncbi:MAG: hypothetical protein OXU67_10240, partial [Chloroflexota bacterium]|nr:hypothetical protein [Chloroflexota bacterium]